MVGNIAMINYISHVVEFEDDLLKISVNYNVQFQSCKDETYCVVPPRQIMGTISKVFNPQQFDFFSVSVQSLPLEKVTRVTDYKGVYGLLSLPPGALEGSITSKTHKVYFGVDRTQDVEVLSKCAFVVCSNKSENITIQDVFDCVKNLSVNLFYSSENLSHDIYEYDHRLYIINLNLKENIELSVYGNIRKVFSPQQLTNLKNIKIN